MAGKTHQHDWSSTIGGYKCLTCNAILTDDEVGTTSAVGVNRNGKNFKDILDYVQKKNH